MYLVCIHRLRFEGIILEMRIQESIEDYVSALMRRQQGMEDVDRQEEAIAEIEERKPRRTRTMEIISTALLSLATLASAWCAYQSARWSGVQTVKFEAANSARLESIRMSNTALQLVTIDVGVFMEYISAYDSGDAFLMDFIYERFRPEMRAAADAWLAADPWSNPDAPRTPFELPQYESAAQGASERFLEQANGFMNEAVLANQRSDNYILLTVIFASVLFFAGTSTELKPVYMRRTLIAFAVVVFMASLLLVLSYPRY
jgi:hypothetical protein